MRTGARSPATRGASGGEADTQPRLIAVPPRPLVRLRKLCLSLPEAHEVEAWGEPTFRVRNKIFAMYADASNHHGGGRHAVWCKALHVNQELLVRSAPDRFFVPPYVGPSGWVGVYLDGSCDWTELTGIVRDSYRLIAPKKLAKALGSD
jgi:predicted DNA-binding protein (MmcQ/YjbR family)